VSLIKDDPRGLMVIPIPARKASQGQPTITGGDHLWWDLRCSQIRTLRWKVEYYFSSLLNF